MDKKNLVFTVLAVALVVVVVFMPDLLTPSGDRAGLRSSISSRLDASKGEPKAGLRRDSSSPSSPLSRVLDTFESKTRVSHKNDQPLVNKPATWGMIQKGEYHEVLASARNRAHIIAKELGGESIKSRYALFDFANGVNFVLSGPNQILSAPDALAYLETLQLKVTRALEEDGVNKNVYKTWRGVSLDASRAVENMKGQIPNDASGRDKFSIILTSVKVNDKKGTLRLRGKVKGTNIDRIELYRNGIQLAEVLKGRPKKKGSEATISFKYHDARGVFAIRAVAKDDTFYERRFRFTTNQGYALNQEIPLREVNWVSF